MDEQRPAKELPKDDAKTKLLHSASRLFAEKGFAGVSTRDISAESGLNISLISYYFEGKEGLYRAVIEDFAKTAQQALAQMAGAFHNPNSTKTEFQSQMLMMIQAMLQLKISKPHIAIILQREMIEGLPNAREIYESIFNHLAEQIIKIFESAQKKGFLRKDINAAVLFFSLIHAVDGYMICIKLKTPLSKKCRQIPEQVDEYASDIFKIFIEGVGT